MSDNIAFFEAMAVRYARTLPLCDAKRFLGGLLEVSDASALPRTRIAFTQLCVTDDQLELIADGSPGVNSNSSKKHS